MTRDPAVRAVFALRVTAAELAAIEAGQPVRRPTWPPRRCQDAIVGLCVDGAVVGEAHLVRAESALGATVLGLWYMDGAIPRDRVLWHFAGFARYLLPLPVEPRPGYRRASSLMPPAPLGTLTAPRADDWA